LPVVFPFAHSQKEKQLAKARQARQTKKQAKLYYKNEKQNNKK
jgi:hypothetical protein